MGLGETGTHGEALRAGFELGGSMGKEVAPQERGNPTLLASSEQLALTDNSSGAGRQSTIPFTALPFPSRAMEQLSGIFPPAPSPCSGTCHASLPALSSGTNQLWS